MYTNQEIIDLCKRQVEKTIKYDLSDKRNSYLLIDFSDKFDSNTKIEFQPNNFDWNESKKQEKIINDWLSSNLLIPLSTQGKLIFSNNGSIEIIEHSFTLFVNMWFHFNREKPAYSFDILDEPKYQLMEYNNRIWTIIKNKGLNSILDETTLFDTKNSVSFFIDIIRHKKNSPIPFNDFDRYDDLVMCHQDIVFAIGELNAYNPYISDFTMSPVNHYGKIIYQYFPTFYDKRYYATCGRIIELLYNYWDKIGDILAPFFASQIPEKKIYFGKVIDNINQEYRNNKHYEWLINFKNNEFDSLNSKRKHIVHYSTIENQIKRGYSENFNNFESLKSKQEEVESFIQYFKLQHQMSIDGFYHSLKLIELK